MVELRDAFGGVPAGENLPLSNAGQDGFHPLGQAVQGGDHLFLALPQLGAQVGVKGDGQLQGFGPAHQPLGGGQGTLRHGGEDARHVEPLTAVQVQAVDVVGSDLGRGGPLPVIGDVRVAFLGEGFHHKAGLGGFGLHHQVGGDVVLPQAV